MVKNLIPWLTRLTTRIGVVGMPPGGEVLFEVAAEQAGRDYNCVVQIIRLAGINKNNVDARIVIKGAPARSGRSLVEIELPLTGSALTDLPEIKKAIVQVLNVLA
jgi:hypothetical protein